MAEYPGCLNGLKESGKSFRGWRREEEEWEKRSDWREWRDGKVKEARAGVWMVRGQGWEARVRVREG